MKSNLNNLINGLAIYLELNSIDEFKALPINDDLIRTVSKYLSISNEKITVSIVAELLNIDRASIYNTYPKTLEYIKGLITLQKNNIRLQKVRTKKGSIKKTIPKSEKFSNLNNEKVEELMSIIMSLAFKKKTQEKQINELKSTIASLRSDITEYKKQLDHY